MAARKSEMAQAIERIEEEECEDLVNVRPDLHGPQPRCTL